MNRAKKKIYRHIRKKQPLVIDTIYIGILGTIILFIIGLFLKFSTGYDFDTLFHFMERKHLFMFTAVSYVFGAVFYLRVIGR